MPPISVRSKSLRLVRIVAELLLPPLVVCSRVFFDYGRIDATGVIDAYLFFGVPSIFYTIAMEVGFASLLRPRSWWTVSFSVALGLILGIATGFYRAGAYDSLRESLEVHIINCLIGFTCTGLIVTIVALRMPNQSPEPMPSSVAPPAGQEPRRP